MKKVVLLLIMVVGFFSCSNNVEFNNPAMQAKQDGEIWKANSFRANLDENGILTVTGSSNDRDNVTLRVPSTALIVYQLGNTTSEATFNDGSSVLFSTNNNPDPDISIFEPDGQIELYEFNGEVVSGRFNFNAFDISGSQTINFNQGDFFRIPLTGGSIDNACEVAIQLATTAEITFNDTPTTDPNYTQVCNAYKNALANEINACGDPNGSIQAIIDSLGDCTINSNAPCDIATANANAAEIVFNSTPNTDMQYPTICEDYKDALTNKISQCGDLDGSIQAIIDNLGDCTNPDDLTGVISVNLGTAGLTFESDITAVEAGNSITISATDDASGNIISFTVQQNATGIDIITNFSIQIGLGGTVYVPTTNPTKTFTSNITINNVTDLNGTFSGTIESNAATAPDLELNTGVIDLMY